MDRQIVYPASIPLDTDILNIQRNALSAIGYLARATLGTSSVADGLQVTPTLPASMQVTVSPGSLTLLSTVDGTAFGSLPADSSDPLVKQGINISTVTMSALTPPSTSGQSQVFLLEASFSEADGTPIVLPYYNSANPAQPYSGPNNTGVAQNTKRAQTVSLQWKAGTPATTGSQTAPAVDSGWTPLVLVTIANGATSITAGNISIHPAAPYIQTKLPNVRGNNMAVYSISGGVQVVSVNGGAAVSTGASVFTVPATGTVKVRIVGGGGGGAGGDATHCGSGGGAGGYSEGSFSGISPGTTLTISVGAGGAAVSGNNPAGNGGTTSVVGGGISMSATGGQGGTAANGANNPGGQGGTATGGAVNLVGGYGTDGYYFGASAQLGGNGAASFFGGGGRHAVNGNSTANMAGQAPGSGAGGAYENSGATTGGVGAPGIVIIEY